MYLRSLLFFVLNFQSRVLNFQMWKYFQYSDDIMLGYGFSIIKFSSLYFVGLLLLGKHGLLLLLLGLSDSRNIECWFYAVSEGFSAAFYSLYSVDIIYYLKV